MLSNILLYVGIWLSAHRVLVILFIGLCMWAAAYIWYFKDEFLRYRHEHRPHKWKVDMATRKATGGKKNIE